MTYDEDELQLVAALMAWMKSQDIKPSKGLHVMLGICAAQIGLKAPTFEELKTGIALAQEQILSNALETFVRHHGYVK